MAAAANKQICVAAGELDDASDQLEALKSRKQTLQDQLSDVNQRINDQQIAVAAALSTLKALVNQ